MCSVGRKMLLADFNSFLLYWQPLNETSETMSLDVIYQPISAGTLRLWVTMMESFRSLQALGNSEQNYLCQ